MLEYAKDALETDKPWLRWEYTSLEDDWTDLSSHPCWALNAIYRRKLPTIMINGYKVPEPMREPPKVGTKYWIVCLYNQPIVSQFTWNNDYLDDRCLPRGICHSTQEAAMLHAKALLSFTDKT